MDKNKKYCTYDELNETNKSAVDRIRKIRKVLIIIFIFDLAYGLINPKYISMTILAIIFFPIVFIFLRKREKFYFEIKEEVQARVTVIAPPAKQPRPSVRPQPRPQPQAAQNSDDPLMPEGWVSFEEQCAEIVAQEVEEEEEQPLTYQQQKMIEEKEQFERDYEEAAILEQQRQDAIAAGLTEYENTGPYL